MNIFSKKRPTKGSITYTAFYSRVQVGPFFTYRPPASTLWLRLKVWLHQSHNAVPCVSFHSLTVFSLSISCCVGVVGLSCTFVNMLLRFATSALWVWEKRQKTVKRLTQQAPDVGTFFTEDSNKNISRKIFLGSLNHGLRPKTPTLEKHTDLLWDEILFSRLCTYSMVFKYLHKSYLKNIQQLLANSNP